MFFLFIFSILYTYISSQEKLIFTNNCSSSNLFTRILSPTSYIVSDGQQSFQHNIETNVEEEYEWTSNIGEFSVIYPSVSYTSNNELHYALFYDGKEIYCYDFISKTPSNAVNLNDNFNLILSSQALDSDRFILLYSLYPKDFVVVIINCSTMDKTETTIVTSYNILSAGILVKNSLNTIYVITVYKDSNSKLGFSVYFINFNDSPISHSFFTDISTSITVAQLFFTRLTEVNDFIVICFSALVSDNDVPFKIFCFHGIANVSPLSFIKKSDVTMIIDNCKYDPIKKNAFSLENVNDDTSIVGCHVDSTFYFIKPTETNLIYSAHVFPGLDPASQYDEFHGFKNNVIYSVYISKVNDVCEIHAIQYSFNVNEPNIDNSYERTNHNAYYFDSSQNKHINCNTNCFACENSNDCIGCKKGSAPLYDNQSQCYLSSETVNDYKYDSINNYFQRCQHDFFYHDEDDQFICSQCGEGKYLSVEYNNCDESCKVNNHYFYGRQCYTECPSNTYKYEETKGCYRYCRTIDKYYYEGECVNECPNNSKSRDNGTDLICEYVIPPASESDEPVEMDISIDEISTILQDNLIQLAEQQSNVKGDGFILQVFTTDNKINDNPGVSSIDLGECEDILRSSYSIPNNESLIISKYDIDQKGAITNKVEYSVYRADGTELDLSKCDDIGVEISYPIINKDNINFEKASEFSSNGIDIYNNDDPFFVDYCISYSESGSDMVRSDRLDDIYTDVPFCAEGCTYEGVNYTTSKAICKCGKPEEDQQKDNDVKEDNHIVNMVINIGNSLYDATNVKLFTCYKQAFDVKKYKSNVGFIFGAVCLFIEIVMFGIFIFCFGMNKLLYKLLKKESQNVSVPPLKQRKALLSRTIQPKGKKHSISYEQYDRQTSIKVNNERDDRNRGVVNDNDDSDDSDAFDDDNDGEKVGNKNKRYSHNINNNVGINHFNNHINHNNYNKRYSHNINNNVGINHLNNHKHINQNKRHSHNINNIDDDNHSNNHNHINQNKRHSHNINNIVGVNHLNNHNHINQNKRYSHMNFVGVNKFNMHDNHFTIHEKLNQNHNHNHIHHSRNNSVYETKISALPVSISSEKEKKEDMSTAVYERALVGEEQNCFRFFFILLFGKIELIKIFFCRGEYELFVVSIAVYIFSLASDFFMNALLFSDDVISQKYNNNGEISPFTTYFLSILSNVLSMVLSSLMFKLTNYSFLFDFIKEQSNNEQHKLKLIQKIVGCVKFKLYIFFLILIPITAVYLYYLSVFCSVYSASQMNWFTNSITSMLLSLLLTLAVSIIITVSRYIGLRCQSRKMYNISLYLNK